MKKVEIISIPTSMLGSSYWIQFFIKIYYESFKERHGTKY